MSPNPKAFKKPSPALSKVPNIAKLYEDLGVRNAPTYKETAFRNQTHQWRKSYRTRSGQPATELKDWNNPNVQSDLTEVAEAFFETYGESYWSADVGWDHRLQYAQDKDRIVGLLKQVFWKQNRYYDNNVAYGPQRETEDLASRTSIGSGVLYGNLGDPITATTAKHTLSLGDNSPCKRPRRASERPVRQGDATTTNPHLAYSAPVAQMTNSPSLRPLPDPRPPSPPQPLTQNHEANTQPIYSAGRLPFWIITDEPKRTEELWPNGNLQQQSLLDCIRAIPNLRQISHLSGIKLTLETATRNTIMPISIDDEVFWEYAKTYLVERLEEVKGSVDGWSSVKIMIEPIYEDNADLGYGLDDDEEFDF